jgi:hypothetical protein
MGTHGSCLRLINTMLSFIYTSHFHKYFKTSAQYKETRCLLEWLSHFSLTNDAAIVSFTTTWF